MRFIWIGKFHTDSEEWIHISRELGEYELIIVDSGCLYIGDERKEYCVSKNQYLIMSPTKHQHGTKPSACGFHWIHFTCEQPLTCPANGSVKNWDIIHSILNTMLQSEFQNHNKVSQELLHALLQELAYENTPGSVTRRLLKDKIDDYLKYNQDSNVKIKTLAKSFGYHEKYLSALFYQENHEHLKHYLMQKNMEKGKNLLLNTRCSISEISLLCGFSDAHNFSRSFRKIYRMSPTQLRRTFEQKDK